MGDLVKKVARTRRSVMGDAVADVTDPIGGQQVQKEDKKALAATLADMQSQIDAKDAEAAPATLIDPGAMPTPSDSQRKARRKSYATQLARKGRAATLLTQADDDSLGSS